jgi:hypothetical protein
MIQINDIIIYNGEQCTCWFIEIIDAETYIHLTNNDSTQGYCVLSSEINN